MEKQFDNSLSAWRKRVTAAGKHPAGIIAYCREEGIALDRYYRWRRRVLGEVKNLAAGPAFAQLVTEPPRRQGGRLPDPRWLAAFLCALDQGEA